MTHESDALHNSLASMTASKSECSRVHAGAEHAYVLIERGQGVRDLEMIAPASHHLQGHHKLSQEGAQWLRTQGFSRGKGRRDFRCTLPSTTGHAELAGRIEEILHRAYGVTVANLPMVVLLCGETGRCQRRGLVRRPRVKVHGLTDAAHPFEGCSKVCACIAAPIRCQLNGGVKQLYRLRVLVSLLVRIA